MRVLGGIATALVVILIGYALAAANLGLWAPWAANKQTEVLHHTNQYVTTQQQKIMGLVHQYDQLTTYTQTEEITTEEGHLIDQMCDAANTIEDQFVPDVAKPLMRERGCWS